MNLTPHCAGLGEMEGSPEQCTYDCAVIARPAAFLYAGSTL